ncbi:hypothetical protein SASPL_104928 [Salvia splendens]|uniref:Uncharacterized protein n=1 Tax=Salvia splendens TaxID=180675 RepID=A0A8X9AB49_SALSN|nr:hypothetical protein SASPL_104928 [Salvia splendens]
MLLVAVHRLKLRIRECQDVCMFPLSYTNIEGMGLLRVDGIEASRRRERKRGLLLVDGIEERLLENRNKSASAIGCLVDGYEIGEKTVRAHVVGRDPEHWENPDEFMPDRFFDAKGQDFGLIPFG